ncbi:MAG: methyltransferase [Pseudanabaena sp.]|nr:MAG: methyltransferase [Pseudanabaena sp.]
MNFLNIGCGSVFDQDWINLDVDPYSKDVKTWDVRKGLPFADNSLDACYSSHVVEHLTSIEAQKLLGECFRVLKRGGVIRLVVPDLEAIARLYLNTLTQIDMRKSEAELNYDWMMLELYDQYDWMMLELYDQTVRSYSGGEMGKYLLAKKNQEFVRSRIGMEAENYWNPIEALKPKIISKLSSKFSNQALQKLRISISSFLVRILNGKEVETAFREAIFRNSGEIHKWMYDRFSLSRLLEECGFVNIKICQAHESSITDFNSYSLDIIDGKVRKPDSLFIEALKP